MSTQLAEFAELIRLLPTCNAQHLRNTLAKLARQWNRAPSDVVNLAYIIAYNRHWSENIVLRLRDAVRWALLCEEGKIHNEGITENDGFVQPDDVSVDDYGFTPEEILIINARIAGYTQAEIAEQLGVNPSTITRKMKKIAKKFEG